MLTDNDRRTRPHTARRILRGGFGAGAVAALLTTAAVATASVPYSSVTTSPRVVHSGQRITITGNGPKNAHAGQWITLKSDAIASSKSVNGVPAIRTQVLVNGKYSVMATIRRGLKPTTYAIAGSYNGTPLDTVAWITVRGQVGRPYSSVTTSARVVRPGQRITITGNGPKNAHAGQWITLKSDAIASSKTVDGIPAIRTQVLVNGKYSVTATIRRGLKPTTYAIAGSYNGTPLDTVAWINVRS
ncbi:MAG: hypothetical protein WAN22_22220 [Solirubrobacteraceae bacterium]